MAAQPCTLVGRRELAQGTLAFHLSKPAGFAFRPGQAFEVQLPSAAAASGEDRAHAFSIVSAPHETELVFATRMRDSAYKRTLAALPSGAPLGIDGPFGSLTLPARSERAAVLIAGGIGITPFVSMIRHAVHTRSARPLALLLSNRRPEDAAFLDELQAHARKLPSFSLHATMTGMAQSHRPWSGATGLMDAAFIRSRVCGLPSPVFYVSGPPGMVRGLQETLAQAGVEEDDVRSEEFHGY